MISIVIPTHEMGGLGKQMLAELLDSLQKQTYLQYEVIVSDDSSDTAIQDFCANYDSIKYYRNQGKRGPSPNLNNAISHAKFSIIKPMFLDDRFLDTDCLEKVAQMNANWCVCTSAHTGGRGDHIPWQSEDLYELARGRNSFGCPSAVAWKRNELTFDESLVWLLDVDFYAKLIILAGEPEIINTRVLIREWEGQSSNVACNGQVRVMELEYIESKYVNLRP